MLYGHVQNNLSNMWTFQPIAHYNEDLRLHPRVGGQGNNHHTTRKDKHRKQRLQEEKKRLLEAVKRRTSSEDEEEDERAANSTSMAPSSRRTVNRKKNNFSDSESDNSSISSTSSSNSHHHHHHEAESKMETSPPTSTLEQSIPSPPTNPLRAGHMRKTRPELDIHSVYNIKQNLKVANYIPHVTLVHSLSNALFLKYDLTLFREMIQLYPLSKHLLQLEGDGRCYILEMTNGEQQESLRPMFCFSILNRREEQLTLTHLNDSPPSLNNSRVLVQNIDWRELQWGLSSLRIREHNFAIHCFQFFPYT